VAERRSHLILLSLLLAALLGVGLLATPGSPMYKAPTLGLDLQGGLEVVLKAVPPKGHELTDEDLDRSVEIMRSRIDKLGVTEPEIRKQSGGQIVVQLAGVRDPRTAAALIGKTAQLELYDLQADLTGPSIDAQLNPIPSGSLYDLLASVQSQTRTGTPEQFYLFNTKSKKVVAGPKPTRAALLEASAVKRLTKERAKGKAAKKEGGVPAGHKIFGVPQNTVVIRCGPDAGFCPGVNATPPPEMYYYLFKYRPNDREQPIPEMTGKDLKLSGTRQDFDTQRGGAPIVTMQFTDDGAGKFHDITRGLAQRGNLRGTNQSFAIVLDREIKSFPTVDFQEYPSGIPGDNGAQITGDFTVQEAKDLALVLQTGALPVNFITLERSDVSATLGKDSLRQALRAAIAGLLIVAIFLLIFYRFLGLVAVLGLGIYAALLYAVLLLLNVTLTLPGFAGMILTLGVAADANIVIFERIKEESRAGKSVRAAIGAGYSKGFATIIDANVVTAITALVLFAVATAGVKGFALMLLIGTAMSLLTAVAATRAILGLLSGFNWFNSPSFMGASGQQSAKWLQIDFMGKRNLWFAISGTILAIGIGSLAIKGLNLGIDFEGGTQVTFRTPQPTAIEDVRAQAREIGQANAQVQGRGDEVAGKFSGFTIRTESLETREQNELRTSLEEELGARSLGVKNVSASFGRQIAQSAILAIVFSLFLIFIYISLRFPGYKFAVPVMAAITHDVLVAVGLYSLTGREVSSATVAAILTVLGYSMYDTIIIFDRIRENIPLMRRSSFATIANVSIWETIRRSLATTFITLLPVGALLFFGGDTLKDFAFALMIGFLSGSYSTIFIASPLLTMWKEREPDYARRVDEDVAAKDGQPVLEAATRAAAAEPEPTLAPKAVPADRAAREAKRERRRQRRRARPHGRAR
jgi:SecD/SecF fusion protein